LIEQSENDWRTSSELCHFVIAGNASQTVLTKFALISAELNENLNSYFIKQVVIL